MSTVNATAPLNPKLVHALDTIASNRGLTRAAILRLALAEFVLNNATDIEAMAVDVSTLIDAGVSTNNTKIQGHLEYAANPANATALAEIHAKTNVTPYTKTVSLTLKQIHFIESLVLKHSIGKVAAIRKAIDMAIKVQEHIAAKAAAQISNHTPVE
jgi:predicted transcriptional regulator